MVVHGGYDGNDTFGDTWILSPGDWTWRQMSLTGKTCNSTIMLTWNHNGRKS